MKPTFVLYKWTFFSVSHSVNQSGSKLHQNSVLTAELNQVELAFVKGFLRFTPPPKKYHNVFENQPLTPPSSDNNLVRQSVSLLRPLTTKAR